MEGYHGPSHDPEYDYVSPLPKPPPRKRGAICGECGKKFEYGVAYGYCCQNDRCPTQFGKR